MLKKITVLIGAVAVIAALAAAEVATYDVAKLKGGPGADSFRADLNGDGAPDKVTLVKGDASKYADDLAKAVIHVESNGKVFITEIAKEACGQSSGIEALTISDNGVSFILFYDCIPYTDNGRKAILYSFDGSRVAEVVRVTSNEPSIEIVDTDRNGVKDIVVTDRDYTGNPQTDKYITTYSYKNGAWRKASVYSTRTKTMLPVAGDAS